jgi:hypothetical protein
MNVDDMIDVMYRRSTTVQKEMEEKMMKGRDDEYHLDNGKK